MGGTWMTANQATFFGAICIVLISASFYIGLMQPEKSWLLPCIPVLLLLRMAMNTLDGMLSREYGTGSVGGELFNESLDVIGDMLCYGVMFFVPCIPVFPVVLFLMLIWMAEYFGVLGKSFPGGIRRHETFLGGKPDRAVWMGVFALCAYFVPSFLSHAGEYLYVVCFFVLVTSVLRIRKTIEAARGKDYVSYTWIGK